MTYYPHRFSRCAVRCESFRRVGLVQSVLLALFVVVNFHESTLAQRNGSVTIHFRDQATQDPLIVRAKIVDQNGKPLKTKSIDYHLGWSLFESPMIFRGRPGEYRYNVWSGPEYSPGSGTFTLDQKSEAFDALELKRHATMSDESWYGCDLATTLPAERAGKWLQAEGLTMAASVANGQAEEALVPSTEESRWVQQQAYHDDRPHSGLVIHHWQPPREVPEWVPSARLIQMAKQSNHDESAEGETKATEPLVEVVRPWAIDLPVWLATEQVDGIQVLGSHLTHEGKGGPSVQLPVPLDGQFDGERGAGRMVEKVYWKMLDAGLRIPATAGSWFGRRDTPLGYNRVYAMAASPDAASLWKSLEAGASFVTSGPLLRVSINGMPPGYVFTAESGKSVELNIALILTVADPVEYLDVIFNGRTLYQARLDEYAKAGGRIPLQSIKESGWLVVRVVTEHDFTYRIASTSPYYIEVGSQPRISRSAATYFRNWLNVAGSKLAERDEKSRTEAAPYVEAARKFWDARIDAATCD